MKQELDGASRQESPSFSRGEYVKIKINTLPTDAKTGANGWQEFVVEAEGQMVTVTVRPKIWNKLTQAAAQYPAWVAAITGKMGPRTPDGFTLNEPTIQVFEKKPKEAKEDSSANHSP